MKLNLMREFVRLAANRNFSRTAEELYMAQSFLSRHVTLLEQELRVKLIDRSTNSFQLTEAGKIVLEEFTAILQNYELLEKLSHLDEDAAGELRLGVLYYDINFYVSKICEVFRHKYPRMKLTLLSYQPRQLEEDLLSGKIDVALLYGAEDCRRWDIEYLPFLKIPYTLIYSKGHRLSAVRDIHISDLDGETLLCPDSPFAINHAGDALERMLREGGASIAEKIPISNFDEVPWLLRDTGAIYISPMANSRAYGDSTEYRFLLPEVYSSDVSAVWLKGSQDPAVPLLCSAIKISYP